MCKILRYEKKHETELLALLKSEPDWCLFTRASAMDTFKEVLLYSETYICESKEEICGYLRAFVDGFGIYVSELYVAPKFRKNGCGKKLLGKIKREHPHQDVYVLSDEDRYYQKLGCKHIGSVFQL